MLASNTATRRSTRASPRLFSKESGRYSSRYSQEVGCRPGVSSARSASSWRNCRRLRGRPAAKPYLPEAEPRPASLSEAARLTDEYVGAEHILVAMADEKEGPLAKILAANGITKDATCQVLVEIRGNQRITDPNPEEKYQALKRYARDFNELARSGSFDPVIGRDEEIRRVVQILSRRTKNNPRPDRGAGGRQDGDRRGSGAAGSSTGTYRKISKTRRSSASISAPLSPGRSTAANSKSG